LKMKNTAIDCQTIERKILTICRFTGQQC